NNFSRQLQKEIENLSTQLARQTAQQDNLVRQHAEDEEAWEKQMQQLRQQLDAAQQANIAADAKHHADMSRVQQELLQVRHSLLEQEGENVSLRVQLKNMMETAQAQAHAMAAS